MPFQKTETIGSKTLENHEGVKDSTVVHTEFEDGTYTYTKTCTVGRERYFIIFEHVKSGAEGEVVLHFGLDGVIGNPITNASLKSFGEIADEMSVVYEQVLKDKKIKTIRINASSDTFSKEDLNRVTEIIAKDPSKLNNAIFSDEAKDFEVAFKDGFAEVITDIHGVSKSSPPPYKIPVTASLLEDMKHIAGVDFSEYVPDIINIINGRDAETKKRHQRLKLYQFYLHKRYPNFTFNSKETLNENGKKDLEFDRDEWDQPYLVVTTNN